MNYQNQHCRPSAIYSSKNIFFHAKYMTIHQVVNVIFLNLRFETRYFNLLENKRLIKNYPYQITFWDIWNNAYQCFKVLCELPYYLPPRWKEAQKSDFKASRAYHWYYGGSHTLKSSQKILVTDIRLETSRQIEHKEERNWIGDLMRW